MENEVAREIIQSEDYISLVRVLDYIGESLRASGRYGDGLYVNRAIRLICAYAKLYKPDLNEVKEEAWKQQQ